MRCLLLGFWLAAMAAAAVAAPTMDGNALKGKALAHLRDMAVAEHPDSRAMIEVDAIDPRLRLPACPTPNFRLSAGSRAWGPGTLEARCDAPTAWSLFLTYRIRLHGPALLARQPLPARHTLAPTDLVLGEVEYKGDPGRYPRDPEVLKGATLIKSVPAGSPVDIDILRRLPLIRAGQHVRILVETSGFQVSQEGIAQQSSAVGDTVKLKTASGRIVQGIVQPDGTVRVRP